METDAAARRLEAAAERAERSGDIEAFIALMHSRYRHARNTGRADVAAALVASARAAANRLRGRFRSRGGRLWAAQQLDETLADYLADELVEGELDAETFEHIEGLRARALFDALHNPVAAEDDSQRLSGDLREAEAALMRFAAPRADQDNITWSELRLASLLPIGGLFEMSERRALLARVEEEYARLEHTAPPVAVVAPLATVQRALAPDEVILEYVVARRGAHPVLPEVWALVITADSARMTRVVTSDTLAVAGFGGSISVDGRAPIDFTPLGELVVKARLAVRCGDDHTASSHLWTLGSVLIRPLFERGLLSAAHRRVIVVPHRMLHYVPYCALPGFDGAPLVSNFAVTLAPSATVWEYLQSCDRPPASRFVGVANPELTYTKLDSLDESARELEAIRRRISLTCDTRVANAATVGFLGGAVPGAGVVHIATHGDFPEDDALDMQRVLLSADHAHDGPLRAEELRRLDMSAVRVVVLSVCNGGLYRFGPGDEPYGLVPAVLGAGAENVVGTLWPIEDDVGRLFMKELYRDLLAVGPAEGLRRTACQFRDDGALIRQWAAFTVIGTGRAFDCVAPTQGHEKRTKPKSCPR